MGRVRVGGHFDLYRIMRRKEPAYIVSALSNTQRNRPSAAGSRTLILFPLHSMPALTIAWADHVCRLRVPPGKTSRQTPPMFLTPVLRPVSNLSDFDCAQARYIPLSLCNGLIPTVGIHRDSIAFLNPHHFALQDGTVRLWDRRQSQGCSDCHRLEGAALSLSWEPSSEVLIAVGRCCRSRCSTNSIKNHATWKRTGCIFFLAYAYAYGQFCG